MDIKIKDWCIGKKYNKNTIIKYNEKYYKCLQEHKSLETWIPTTSDILWKNIEELKVFENTDNDTHDYGVALVLVWLLTLPMFINMKLKNIIG